MRNLSLGRRHLVNAYEVEAGFGIIAGNTEWSMPERFECEVLQKARYINTLTFILYLICSPRIGKDFKRDTLAALCIFRPCDLVRNISVLHFPPPVTWSVIFRSCIFRAPSFRQTNQSPSHSPHFTHASSCSWSSLLPSITPLSHPRLKTYHFHKSP